MDMTGTKDRSKLRRDWSDEAISLAMKGDWQRATEVNQAILALYPGDVEAMNRLGRAFIELSEYQRARETLEQVASLAPYNNIAKKNLARLEQLESSPAGSRQVSNTGGAPRLFIAESGKSGNTVLQKPTSAVSAAPGELVNLVVENKSLRVYGRNDEFLGQVEPKLANRLIKLLNGGNRYEAALIGTSDWGISITIRETYRHPSLHNIASFPTSSRNEGRVQLGDDLLRYLEQTFIDEAGEDEEEEERELVGYGAGYDVDWEWDE